MLYIRKRELAETDAKEGTKTLGREGERREVEVTRKWRRRDVLANTYGGTVSSCEMAVLNPKLQRSESTSQRLRSNTQYRNSSSASSSILPQEDESGDVGRASVSSERSTRNAPIDDRPKPRCSC